MNKMINYELVKDKKIVFTLNETKKEIATYDIESRELNLFTLKWYIEYLSIIKEVIDVYERFLEKKKLIDEEIYDLFNGDDEDYDE